jgi:hypothetical protein
MTQWQHFVIILWSFAGGANTISSMCLLFQLSFCLSSLPFCCGCMLYLRTCWITDSMYFILSWRKEAPVETVGTHWLFWHYASYTQLLFLLFNNMNCWIEIK